MTEMVKNTLLQMTEQLYEKQEYEKIMELLMRVEVKDDYDLSYIMMRTLLDLCDIGQVPPEQTEAAEMMPAFFPKARRDPRVIYQLARSYGFRRRYIEAFCELKDALRLADEGSDFPEREDALELLSVLKEEYYKVCSKVYSKDQRYVLLTHMFDTLGTPYRILSESHTEGIHVDIVEIPPEPDEDRDYVTLVTLGMGAHTLNVPEKLKDKEAEHCEFVFYLPPDADEELILQSAGYMTVLSRLPVERNSWVGKGHIFSNGSPVLPCTKQQATAVTELRYADEEAAECYVPNLGTVRFYQLFPLYFEEAEFKMRNKVGVLEERLKKADITAIFDPDRPNVCAHNAENKAGIQKGEEVQKPVLLAEEIDYVSDKDIGTLCAASKMITERGERVGYMRRFYFDFDSDEMPANCGDSGWLFLSGLETPAYLSDPNNIEMVNVNTICNIDSDIVPFLTMPYNTIIVRKPDGKLYVSDEYDEDDLSDELGNKYFL